MNLKTLKDTWENTPEFHQQIHESFIEQVNNDDELNRHRSFVENNVWGFGERSFHWLWKLLVDEMPTNFSFLEIGCFKGQVLSLIRLLARKCNKNAIVCGVTPLDSTGIEWESDYASDIERIHEEFELKQPFIKQGRSDNAEIIKTISTVTYDIIYIDGGHEREDIDNDLLHYAPLVKQGGYLVIDDACTDMNMPWGFFQGILPVTEGVLEYMVHHGSEWQFIGNVVHLRIYRKK